MKTLAVVVTHNRCALLERCINHLLVQSRLPSEILVINNASTDGTLAMLEQRRVTVITQDNLGSAGGWHRGIQYAIDGNFDAVWLMDDDGYPDTHALELLEKQLRREIVCASSVVVCEDYPDRFVFPFPLLDSSGIPKLFAYPRKIALLDKLRSISSNGMYPFAHFFNGALISVTAARKAGNVNCDFFMFGDEVDYFFRLRQTGQVVSVLNAFHFHPDVTDRPYTPAKVYYFVKNTLILNRRYLNWVWLRDILAVLVVLVRTARRNGLLTAMEYISGKHRMLLTKAISRGLRGQIAKDFNG
jgi:rhamnopyranosyl-N-acetylglucosaminyl-diphospho-decaprenol beta-1,3/1,4-galactofuranosyltransferase